MGRGELLEEAKLRGNLSHSKILHIQWPPESAGTLTGEISVTRSLRDPPRERNTMPGGAGDVKRLGRLKVLRNSEYLVQTLS